MDTLRMDPRDCEEITRQMLLNSVDAWWAQYRSRVALTYHISMSINAVYQSLTQGFLNVLKVLLGRWGLVFNPCWCGELQEVAISVRVSLVRVKR